MIKYIITTKSKFEVKKLHESLGEEFKEPSEHLKNFYQGNWYWIIDEAGKLNGAGGYGTFENYTERFPDYPVVQVDLFLKLHKGEIYLVTKNNPNVQFGDPVEVLGYVTSFEEFEKYAKEKHDVVPEKYSEWHMYVEGGSIQNGDNFSLTCLKINKL